MHVCTILLSLPGYCAGTANSRNDLKGGCEVTATSVLPAVKPQLLQQSLLSVQR